MKFLRQYGLHLTFATLAISFITWMVWPKQEYVPVMRFWVNGKFLQVPLSVINDLGNREPYDTIEVRGTDGTTYYKGPLGDLEIAIADTILVKRIP